MEEDYLLPEGTICNLIDAVDIDKSTMCTIKMIEPDDEVEGLYFYYLVANNEDLNIIEEPGLGWKYFAIVGSGDPNLTPISLPV